MISPKIIRPLAPLLSWLYGGVLKIRHWLYDVHWKRSVRPDITTICVGNITVGGTGKTPMVEFLVERLGRREKVAVLSRGYGRRTKGYIEVRADMSYRDVGDEPKQIKCKFGEVLVVVCEKRAEGIRRIHTEHPEIKFIIMDDGFQHRSVRPHVNIVLVDYTRPVFKDRLLPWGELRDLPSQMKRADIVVVTKTPPAISAIDKRLFVKKLKLRPFQRLYFTSVGNDALRAQFPAEALPVGDEKVLLTGVGNPNSVYKSTVGKFGKIEKHFVFKDHHRYKMSELSEIVCHYPEATVLTTEKDAVKMTKAKTIPDKFRERLYIMPIKLCFIDNDSETFIQNIYNDVKENRKSN